MPLKAKKIRSLGKNIKVIATNNWKIYSEKVS
jgi:hypothetical protein